MIKQTKLHIILLLLTVFLAIMNFYLLKDVNLKVSHYIILGIIYSGIISVFISLFLKIQRENREMNKDIMKSDQIKSHFLANISHELRTPLNGVLGMNNLLLNSELKKEQKEYAEIISSCGESLLSTINDILDYSKIEKGELFIESIHFDLRKLMKDFYNTNQLSANQKDISFSSSIDPEVSNYFSGDPGRIKQILTNLYSNALKFTNSGSITIGCEVLKEHEDYSTLLFSVSDTGIGIEKKELDFLFKEFTQSDSSATREYEGTGLGLAISNQLVDLMSGKIGAFSKPDEGSTFWFSLDLKRGSTLLKPKKMGDIYSATCLVIGSDTKSHISNIFINESIDFSLSESFEKAKEEIIHNNKFDIVIFDLHSENIQELSLVDFTEFINKKTESKMLALASTGNKGDGELCRNLGIDGYLVKPFYPTPLLETISIIIAEESENTDLVTIHTLKENKRSAVKILLVDDNDINLIIAEKLLRKMGFHAGKASNGSLALEELKKETYSIIFMDIQMPVMNGLQATANIRKEIAGYHNKDIPIIALTANSTPQDRENCSKSGMNEFLTKPLNPRHMEEMINRYVKWDEL
ncbi:MAG: response regulator [Spirochaetaceae bacterium]